MADMNDSNHSRTRLNRPAADSRRRARNAYDGKRGAQDGRMPRRDGGVAGQGVSGGALNVLAAKFSTRAGKIMALFVFVAILFIIRLIQFQIVMPNHYLDKAGASPEMSYPIPARRGTIYDRNGTVIATSVDATTIYANPEEVTNASKTAQILADIFGDDVADFEALLTTPDTTFVYLKKRVDVEKADELRERLAKEELEGVYYIDDFRREYPYGEIGGQVIGYYSPEEGSTLTGLELQYDDILRGTDGEFKAAQGQRGTVINGSVEVDEPAVDGRDIVVSIDIDFQAYVERTLAEGVEQMDGESGTAVVMDASTGEIYAACSLPLMNPADMSKLEPGGDQLKAVTQAFEPGSVFKTVAAMSILEDGAMKPETEIECPEVLEADGYEVKDAHDRPACTYTLQEVIAESSNVGISLAVEESGFQSFFDHIVAYNLNEATDVDYPGEASGSLQDFGSWARITGYNTSFGQGIACTPIQITRFYGALANEGVEVTPHFLIDKPLSDETLSYPTEQVIKNTKAIPDMVSMLQSVVSEGTGQLAEVEGFKAAGKTSTAEIAAEGGGYRKGVYNLCFCGFLPDSTSDLVCFVSANEVAGMGTVAHLFSDIMTYAVDRFRIMPE